MSALPSPAPSEVGAPYREGLAAGRLSFQRCDAGHPWLPPRTHCPRCLSDELEWCTATGRGELVSWVVYHRAFAPAFEDRLPYNVALVELEEGPRLITNVVGIGDPGELQVGVGLLLRIEREGELYLARFAPA